MIFTKSLKYIVLIFFIVFETGWATTYYLDASKGNDNFSGLDANHAWRTINKINKSSFHSGDIIAFKRGETFSGYTLKIDRSSKYNGITFSAYGSGKRPVIDGGDSIEVVNVNLVDNLTFEHIEFLNGPRSIISFDVNTANYLTINDCVFDGKGTSGRELAYIGSKSDNLVVRNCTFQNGGLKYLHGAHGLYFAGNNVIIEHNKFINFIDGNCIKDNAVNYNGRVFFDQNITIRYNYCEGTNNGCVYLQSADGAKIYNNLLITGKNYGHGVVLSLDNKWPQVAPRNVKIYNNTIILTPDLSSGGILLSEYSQIDSITIKNNIIYSPNTFYGHIFIDQGKGGGKHLFINNNLYYTAGKTSDRWRIQGTYYNNFKSWQGLGFDKFGKWGDPLFNNISKGDYTLKKGSPAINSGLDVGLKKDFNGKEIPSTKPDMGAFQHTYIDVNTKVFLEGPYKNGTMADNLLSLDLIPKSQPYNTSPWKYSGSESVTAVPANVVDWVLIELRTNTGSASTAAKRAGFLLTDGSVVDLDGKSPLRFDFTGSGNYYIVIKHRNHLAVMSSKPVALNGSSALYDFTSSQSKAYGVNPMVALDKSVYGMYGGDGDANGGISSTDRNKVWKHEDGSAGYLPGDFDLSSRVDNTDLNSCWRSSNGTLTQVPN